MYHAFLIKIKQQHTSKDTKIHMNQNKNDIKYYANLNINYLNLSDNSSFCNILCFSQQNDVILIKNDLLLPDLTWIYLAVSIYLLSTEGNP